jgi:hypothetical protein
MFGIVQEFLKNWLLINARFRAKGELKVVLTIKRTYRAWSLLDHKTHLSGMVATPTGECFFVGALLAAPLAFRDFISGQILSSSFLTFFRAVHHVFPIPCPFFAPGKRFLTDGADFTGTI